MPLASQNRMKGSATPEFIARLVSDIANPLIIPPIVLLFIGFTEHLSFIQIGKLFALSTIFYVVIPAGIAMIISRRKTGCSLDFPDRSSRIALYSFSIFSMTVGSLLIIAFFTTPGIQTAVGIFLVNLLCNFIINFRWKISVHSTALSAGGVLLLLFGFVNSTGIASLITGLILLFLVLPLII